ncbi:Twinfilin [Fulvia fulva]|uniref:Twinfilin n=1 Tax=Passalora fulva TaxID=5499 RepID=A0A9Q8LJ69_PASFU|nr:Twinfilin [Fulvia fulva]KAK4624644.1 Twinfilin [Fulvia fulva]UJO18129.1 Twinfilin [Fulvia fulva]WPV15360.1 Twinfilin [Fulvia fulva]WPV30196.1 Twinfilin [Fulvia fulva]
MQSGISASQELHDAFNSFVSASDQRALLAGIEKEQLVPKTTIPLNASDFKDDLGDLQSHLSPNEAAYILLKVEPGAANGFIAVTFVPNSAPVRQKMLFAATRLTLVRELGIERFRSTLFATEKDELTAHGWTKHEQHESLSAPLTEEEAGLAGVKEAEAQESQGTGARRGHVDSKMNVPTGEGVLEALTSLKEEGCKGTLVQLKFQLPGETLTLDSSQDNVQPAQVARTISSTEPRYSFYSLPSSTEPNILFIYTCPTSSKIKERMIYSTSKSWTRIVAERDAGITVTKSLEATEPSELTADVFGGESTASTEQGGADTKPTTGFARPKRPGRR